MIQQTDAFVIGAGPGGCAAAIALARAGFAVAIAEAKPFPRAKVCGEFISPAATAALERLIPPERLRSLGAERVGRFHLELNHRELSFPMRTPAWVLSRRSLDDALLAEARDAGAEILQPAAVRAVDHHADHATVTIDHQGETRTRTARVVIHADGSGRFAKRRTRTAQPQNATPKRQGVVGLKCHIKQTSTSRVTGIRMRAAHGAYIGSVAVEHANATIALVARSRLVKQAQQEHGPIATSGGDALLAKLWPAFERDARQSPWLSSGVPGSPYRPPKHPRDILVGNAAAAVEPVGGEGIGLAVRAGLTAADLLAATPSPWSPSDLQTLQREHARRYRRRLRFRRPACRLAAAVLERPALVNAAWPFLSAPIAGPAIVESWLRCSGKPARS